MHEHVEGGTWLCSQKPFSSSRKLNDLRKVICLSKSLFPHLLNCTENNPQLRAGCEYDMIKQRQICYDSYIFIIITENDTIDFL